MTAAWRGTGSGKAKATIALAFPYVRVGLNRDLQGALNKLPALVSCYYGSGHAVCLVAGEGLGEDVGGSG